MNPVLALVVGAALLQIGAGNRRDVVEALATVLSEGYVNEAVGKQAADTLRGQRHGAISMP